MYAVTLETSTCTCTALVLSPACEHLFVSSWPTCLPLGLTLGNSGLFGVREYTCTLCQKVIYNPDLWVTHHSLPLSLIYLICWIRDYLTFYINPWRDLTLNPPIGWGVWFYLKKDHLKVGGWRRKACGARDASECDPRIAAVEGFTKVFGDQLHIKSLQSVCKKNGIWMRSGDIILTPPKERWPSITRSPKNKEVFSTGTLWACSSSND